MKNKNVVSSVLILVCILVMITPIYASDLQDSSNDLSPSGDKLEVGEDYDMVLPVNEAVLYGLENNPLMEILENKIKLAVIQVEDSKENIDDLEDARSQLKSANKLLRNKENELKDAQADLDKATIAINAGFAPIDIPLVDASGQAINDPSGNQLVIPIGNKIIDFLLGLGLPQETAQVMNTTIINLVKEDLKAKQDLIDENAISFSEAKETLSFSEGEYDHVIGDVSKEIEDLIGYNSTINLPIEGATKLMLKMAGVNLDVTVYAKDIYRNQIAMLIRKNYYDALYAKNMVTLKTIAYDRGLKQYELLQLSFDNGMKSKDDLLLSKMYSVSKQLELMLAEASYNNTIYELKKNMNVDMDVTIGLIDTMEVNVTEEILEEGLRNGLLNRFEIRQNLGEFTIYELNQEIIQKKYKYYRDSYMRDEADIMVEQSKIQLESTKQTIRSDIYQSYELMTVAGDMLKISEGLIANAREVVKISELKYEQGFGIENGLLKDLNLESSSGTIIELIAAKEKLSEVECQVANIRYNYTMARIKYLNDAGILLD